MNTKGKEILFALCLGLLLPGILMCAVQVRNTQETGDTATQSSETQDGQREFMLPVLTAEGTVEQMRLNDYVTCVVLAEMPAEFDPEALKAQAVVARTYALRRYQSGGKHVKRAVCTDSACCQAFCTQSSFLDRGESRENLQKVIDAVEQTEDQVLTYAGALIEATYFSCSGGRTEGALAVWGADIPYLQAVDSPGEENASHYMDTVSFTVQDFVERMGLDSGSLSGNWIGPITYTAGGGVDKIRIGGQSYKGTTVRQKLGLRSTAFVITAVGNSVTVTTKGFGHRVGMSQYGAEAMAVSGSDYGQILSYYYQGTTLEKISETEI
jgi:stage II sporulation protein D